MNWLHQRLLHLVLYRKVLNRLKLIHLSFLGSFSLYDLCAEFLFEIQRESIFIKSSALSYQFLLAIFPGLIFLFTLIAFIPIPNFQLNVLNIFQHILPESVYIAAEETLKEVIIKKNGGLLSFGFFASLYFSTSGMSTLIQSFHKSFDRPDKRSYLVRKILALFLTICLTLLLLIAALVGFAGHTILQYFQKKQFIQSTLESPAIGLLQILLVAFLFYIGIALLYYFGPKRNVKRTFFTFGAALASVASLLTTQGFAYYVSHFSTYNKLYGSIGTLIVTMGLLYLNSAILLLGYDLELSISRCRAKFKSGPRGNHFSEKFKPIEKNTGNQIRPVKRPL